MMDPITFFVIDSLVGAWVLFLGASIGSFCNVVAYRLPRGLPIGWARSKCPSCQAELAWFDNIPVLGWLALNGRCRRCGWKIPIRYLLVEVAYGAVFVAIWWHELRPLSAQSPAGPLAFITPEYAGQTLLAVHHAVLLSILGVVSLMRAEGSRVPTSLFITALACGFASIFFGYGLGLSATETTLPLLISRLWGLGLALAVDYLATSQLLSRFLPISNRLDGRVPLGSTGLPVVACFLDSISVMDVLLVALVAWTLGWTFLGSRTVPGLSASLLVLVGTLVEILNLFHPHPIGYKHPDAFGVIVLIGIPLATIALSIAVEWDPPLRADASSQERDDAGTGVPNSGNPSESAS